MCPIYTQTSMHAHNHIYILIYLYTYIHIPIYMYRFPDDLSIKGSKLIVSTKFESVYVYISVLVYV